MARRVLRSRSSPRIPHSRGLGSGPVEVHSHRQAPRAGQAVGHSHNQARVAVECHTVGCWAGGSTGECRTGWAPGCHSARAAGQVVGSAGWAVLSSPGH